MNKIHITSGDYFYIVEDLVRGMTGAFIDMGHEVTFDLNSLRTDSLNINLGAALTTDDFKLHSDRLIHFNLEQIDDNNYQIDNPKFWNTLNTGFVWDYCDRNVQRLTAKGINCYYVPIGYNDRMTFIESKSDLDIDVLFYGYETPDRKEILDIIRIMGYNVVTPNIIKPYNEPWRNVYRNEMISRAKVVINLHAWSDNNIFEEVRVSHLLANHKAVVAEVGPYTYVQPDMLRAVMHGTRSQLPGLCKFLVEDATARKIQEYRGFEVFKQRDFVESLLNGLSAYYNWKLGRVA